MNLWERIKHAVLSDRSSPSEAAEARAVAQRISAQADQLNESLQKYHRARDPFAAMMADLYNRDQLNRLHRGPKP